MQSLWNLLSFKRVLLLTQHGQDPFGQLDDSYKEELDITQQQLRDQICPIRQIFSTEHLFHLLNLLYKLIVFKLMNSSTVQELDNMEMCMADVLQEMIEQEDLQIKRINSEYNFKSLKLKNVYQLWKFFVSLYS